MSGSLQPHESQHAGPPCPSPTPRVHSDSHPLSQWCHPVSHPLSSPSLPAPNPSQHQSFPMSQLFAWGGQSTEVSALASFFPKNTQDWSPLYSPWNSLGQNTGVGSLFLLQGILPIQGLNPSIPHCRQILYQLSYKGSPRILEWVIYPFSSRSSWPSSWIQVSCIGGGFFTNWIIRVALIMRKNAATNYSGSIGLNKDYLSKSKINLPYRKRKFYPLGVVYTHSWNIINWISLNMYPWLETWKNLSTFCHCKTYTI